MKRKEYILYKVHDGNEVFVDIGTSKELADFLCINVRQFHQLVKDSKRKRSNRPQEGRYKAYRLEEQENEI